MGLIHDLAVAVEDYPITDVDVEIVDVVYPGNVLNAGEEGTFKVKVSNRGPLNLTNLKVKVAGVHDALVRDPDAVTFPNGPLSGAIAATPSLWRESFISREVSALNAHTSVTLGGPYKFKAPEDAQPSQTLLKATIEAWNANLNHILIDHTAALPDAPKGTYSLEVVNA
jgi:hypothetical protein